MDRKIVGYRWVIYGSGLPPHDMICVQTHTGEYICYHKDIEITNDTGIRYDVEPVYSYEIDRR